MVVSRSFSFSIVRADIMPGMAQAKLDNNGMNARPFKPTRSINSSIRNAARAIYPDASSAKMNANRITICGRKTTTLPTPAMTPSMSRLLNHPSLSDAPSHVPSAANPSSIHVIGVSAHVNTAWNIKNRSAARMKSPATGCSTTLSTARVSRFIAGSVRIVSRAMARASR